MNINGFALYKVVEFDKGIILLNALDSMPGRQCVELVMADAKTCGEYLARYLHARGEGAAGKTIEQAHKEALAGAKVVQRKWEPGSK